VNKGLYLHIKEVLLYQVEDLVEQKGHSFHQLLFYLNILSILVVISFYPSLTKNIFVIIAPIAFLTTMPKIIF